MMSECQNNDTCYEYDKVQMWANYRDGAVSLCLNEVGSGVDAAACQFFSDYGDMMVDDAIDFALSYEFDDKYGIGNLLSAQRGIEMADYIYIFIQL